MSTEIRFQYLAQNAERPISGYLITDVPVEITPCMPIPRVGEIVRHLPVHYQGDAPQFVVLSVHYDIVRNSDDHRILEQWTVTVTLGDIPPDMDNRLLNIRD